MVGIFFQINNTIRPNKLNKVERAVLGKFKWMEINWEIALFQFLLHYIPGMYFCFFTLEPINLSFPHTFAYTHTHYLNMTPPPKKKMYFTAITWMRINKNALLKCLKSCILCSWYCFISFHSCGDKCWATFIIICVAIIIESTQHDFNHERTCKVQKKIAFQNYFNLQ